MNSSPLPYDEWLDGGVHMVTRQLVGTDLASFRSSLNLKARSKGFGIKTEMSGEVMYIIAFPLDKFRGGLEMLYKQRSMEAVREA